MPRYARIAPHGALLVALCRTAVVSVGLAGVLLAASAAADELASRRAVLKQELRQALDAQERWLGDGASAAGWASFLRADELRAQLAGDDETPDLLALHEIKAQYAAQADGLDRTQFTEVHQALDRWIASLPEPTPAELAAMVRSGAARGLDASNAQLEASHAALRAAYAELDSFFNRSPRNGPGWRAHLLTADLAGEIAAPGSLDDERLQEVFARFNSGHGGLEITEFALVRDALADYRRDRLAVALDNPAAARSACLDRLAQHLDREAVRRRNHSLDGIAESLAWLDRHGFDPAVVEVVRRSYVQPNLYARISGDAFAAQFERDVEETFPVNSYMSGARVTGQGRLAGRIDFELVPDAERASFRMLFAGDITTTTTARSGPVGINGRGRTRLTAEKRIHIDHLAVHSQAADAQAETALTTTGIWSKFNGPVLDRVARRIGSKKNAASRGSNERSVSQQAEADLERRFEQEAAALLDGANEAYVSQFRVPFHQYGIFPRDLRLSTTSEHVCLQATLADAGQLAALTPPPALDDRAAVSIVVHESLFNNLAATTLAGRTLESTELGGVLDKLVGDSPMGFETVDGVPWALSIAEREPLEIRLSDEGVSISIRCRGINAGAEKFEMPFAVSARYRTAIDGRAIVFHRQGGLEVASPAGFGKLNDGLTDSQQAIGERFEMLLQPELRFTLDQLPFKLPLGDDLVPTEFSTTDGWVRLNLNAPAATSTEAIATRTSAE